MGDPDYNNLRVKIRNGHLVGVHVAGFVFIWLYRLFCCIFVAVNFWIFTCGHDWEFLQGPLKSQKDTLPETNRTF